MKKSWMVGGTCVLTAVVIVEALDEKDAIRKAEGHEGRIVELSDTDSYLSFRWESGTPVEAIEE